MSKAIGNKGWLKQDLWNKFADIIYRHLNAILRSVH
jgi:hypothetical protein